MGGSRVIYCQNIAQDEEEEAFRHHYCHHFSTLRLLRGIVEKKSMGDTAAILNNSSVCGAGSR